LFSIFINNFTGLWCWQTSKNRFGKLDEGGFRFNFASSLGLVLYRIALDFLIEKSSGKRYCRPTPFGPVQFHSFSKPAAANTVS
jgi:hypothetical protein